MDYIYSDGEQRILIETEALNQGASVIDELIKFRKDMNLTQQDIADATGMCRANIARIEGKKYVPTLEVLMRYAACLGYEINLSLSKKN